MGGRVGVRHSHGASRWNSIRLKHSPSRQSPSTSAWGCWISLRTQIRHRICSWPRTRETQETAAPHRSGRATTSSATSSSLAIGARVCRGGLCPRLHHLRRHGSQTDVQRPVDHGPCSSSDPRSVRIPMLTSTAHLVSALPSSPLVSVEDYLAGELVAEQKHEYVGGLIYMMSGARNRHNRIASRATGNCCPREVGRAAPAKPSTPTRRSASRAPARTRFYVPRRRRSSATPTPTIDVFQDRHRFVFDLKGAEGSARKRGAAAT